MIKKIKILIVFGTRPEVIKLAPVIKELRKNIRYEVFCCSTGQHKEMIAQVNSIFRLKIDYDLKLMKYDQNLSDLTAEAAKRIKTILHKMKPDLVVVQGDTTSAMVASLAAFYFQTKVAHVEAGLRSNNIFSPYPEELNRKIISLIADFNFAPTKLAKQNLLEEGIEKKKIWVTGNTVIDSISWIKKKLNNKKLCNEITNTFEANTKKKFLDYPFILITMHRREKFGKELENITFSLKSIAENNRKYNFVYPIHLNPNVKKPVERILKGVNNFLLLPPVDYLTFIYLMKKCQFIISDSGGIQEECSVFKKPIIVLRKNTERSEAIAAGYAFLAGHSPKRLKDLFYKVNSMVEDGYNFFKQKNPFGDGRASIRIAKIIQNKIG